jgi:hypothetical protein
VTPVLEVEETTERETKYKLPRALQKLLEETSLGEAERRRVEQLLRDNLECFMLGGDTLGHTSLVHHHIDTGTILLFGSVRGDCPGGS